ncbi:MAG: elongation factor P [Candidatus Dojkabacteria bacterium]|nr:elongation factor P [Candidatus Dojkabacteria bacterium]
MKRMPLTDQPTRGMYIIEDGRVFHIIDRKLKTQGRQGGLIIMKIKALDSGQLLEKTIKAGVKVEYIEPETIEVQYLYSDENSCYFMDSKTYESITINRDIFGNYVNFLKEGEKCLIMRHEGKAINFKGSPTVDLKVIESTPAVRGNTANSASKLVTVETGYRVNVPLFIKKGDLIKVSTETGEYSGKAS